MMSFVHRRTSGTRGLVNREDFERMHVHRLETVYRWSSCRQHGELAAGLQHRCVVCARRVRLSEADPRQQSLTRLRWILRIWRNACGQCVHLVRCTSIERSGRLFLCGSPHGVCTRGGCESIV